MHGDRTVDFRITTWCVSVTPHPTLKMIESERFELSLIGSEPIELTIILTLNYKLSKIIIIKNPNTTFVRFGLTISWKWNYKSVSNLNSMKEAKQTMLLKPNYIIHIHNSIYKLLLILLMILLYQKISKSQWLFLILYFLMS